MSDKRKQIEPIPEEFGGYEEAAEFWDTHDTTDYTESFEAVAVESELRRRRYEIEIDEDLMKALTAQAQKRGVAVGELVSELLREKIRPAA
jgi:predicted DNA binding CopG/RHH family protein